MHAYIHTYTSMHSYILYITYTILLHTYTYIHVRTVANSLYADKLIRQIGLKDNAEIVDLTGSKVVVESLTETRIMCTVEDKVWMSCQD